MDYAGKLASLSLKNGVDVEPFEHKDLTVISQRFVPRTLASWSRAARASTHTFHVHRRLRRVGRVSRLLILFAVLLTRIRRRQFTIFYRFSSTELRWWAMQHMDTLLLKQTSRTLRRCPTALRTSHLLTRIANLASLVLSMRAGPTDLVFKRRGRQRAVHQRIAAH